MRGVTTWGGRVSTGATVGGGVSDGAQGHWGAAALDAGFLLAPNLMGKFPTSIDEVRGFGDVVTNVFGAGDHAVEVAGATARGAADYRRLLSWGINPKGAASLAFDGEPPAIVRDINPADGQAVRRGRAAGRGELREGGQPGHAHRAARRQRDRQPDH